MTMNSQKVVTILVSLLCCLSCATSYKYLAVIPTTARSHYNVGSALLKGLARKGHDVTVISPLALKPPMEHYHEILTPSVFKAMEGLVGNILEMRENSIMKNFQLIYDMGVLMSDAILNEPQVQALLQSNQTFDAVICEIFVSEALFGLSEHFKAPLIGLGTFGATTWNTDMVGSPSPYSYVPHAFLDFTDHMTLLQRIGNLAIYTVERIIMDYHYLPRQEALYSKYFPHLTRSLTDIRKNTAFVLLNQHVSLSTPRPYMPNMVEVGGMHINRKRKPLPEDIQKFIDEAKDGVIYFSMGSNLQSKDLPIEKRQEILNTLRSLKQRVLWKFEDANLVGKPDNVYISDWFPQDDILAHKNVLAFVTHGGLLSTTESIYHGKPFIGIPMFGDQFLNMARAELYGYGIMVDYNTLSARTFKAAIERILTDPSYTHKVQDMSTRYRDQPMEPLDLAVYWTEHVARHKGAKYMHCAGQDLNFVQYHNIDAMLILFGGLLLVLLLILWTIRKLLRSVFGGSSAQKNTKIKKN